MNKEIEISPRQIAKAINDLLDEKEKLEQENKELEEYITYWQKETDKRQDKIDNAIEYIEENRDYQDILFGRTGYSKGEMFTEDILREKNIEVLLNILKDSDGDDK